jgi:His/Glu/Gln/Arg/opine family amino acid ABC transporter permease subunit
MGSIFKILSDAIYYNLIREQRYMLFIDGLGVSLQLTLFAAILGTVIGLIVAIIRLTNVKILNRIASIYVDVIRGTPVVVQLVIIYYAILGTSNLPKIMVASIAFGINSGAYVSELIRAGILAVDKGQMEAARSLGFSYASSMRYIIIPQAVKNILPALLNEFIALLKETAIAGYIALDDLTRAGNIVRGRTFDAYTPFILVAIIYLYITTILSWLMGKLERRMRQSD